VQVKKGRLGAIEDSFLQDRVRNLQKIQWLLCLHLSSQVLMHTVIVPSANVNTVVHTSKNAHTHVKASANVNTVVHTSKNAHTHVKPTANVNTDVHTSKNAHTHVKASANVNTDVHTSKNAHTVIKPSANVTTVVKPTPNAQQPVMKKPVMHKKPPTKPSVKTLDVVRAIVEPIVKVKQVRRSSRTIWKGPKIKDGPGKDMENPIELVDEEVAEATGSGKDVAEASPRKLRDECGTCLALLRSVENVRYI
jgi:hypothetical protein